MPNENNLPEPITRDEKYLAKAAGAYDKELPEPITRVEKYLNAIADGAGGDSYTKAETDALLSAKADLVNGTIPASEIPPEVFERMKVVADDTARFALTKTDVQNGDIVYVNATQIMYYVYDDTKLDVEAGYKPFAAGTAAKAIADKNGADITTTYQTSTLGSWTAGSATSHSTPASTDTVLEALEKIDNNQRLDETNILSVEEEIYTEFQDVDFYAEGYWAVANGEAAASSYWLRSCQEVNNTISAIRTTNNGYKLFLLAYDGNTYVGTWFGESFLTEYDTSYISRSIDIEKFRKIYPNYTFKIDVTAVSGHPYNKQECLNSLILTKSNIKEQADYTKITTGDIAKKEFWENGTINSRGEKDTDAATTDYRLSTNRYLRFLFPVTLTPKSGYVFSVTTYSLDKSFETQFSAWSNVPFTFSNSERLYKIVIKASNGETVSANNLANYIETKLFTSISFERILSEVATVRAINHRGYNTIAPENTLPAFSLSARLGYKYVECDVLFTADGVPVILHDDTINRTARNSDGSGISETIAIEDITYAEALEYDFGIWKGTEYAGTKIPTLAEFLMCCKALNLNPWIELKWTHTYTQSEIQQIISTIKQYGMEEYVTFISFSYDALALVVSEWETVTVGLNGNISDAIALKTGKNRVFMIYNQNTDYSEAIQAGFQVCVYTIDTIGDIVNLDNYGYDSILTNCLLQSQITDVVKYIYSIQ